MLSAQLDMAQPLEGPHRRLRQQFRGAPVQVLAAHSAEQLAAVLEAVEAAARSGAWCVGGLQYEAASALQPGLMTHAATGPLAWFAVYAPPVVDADAAAPDEAPGLWAQSLEWQPGMDQAVFAEVLAQIHADIAAGRYYQLNLTQQHHGHSAAPIDRAALFAALQRAQPEGYGIYLDRGEEALLSVSPELFFDWHQPASGSGHILTRPMKGTAARGSTPQQDAAQAEYLRSSAKERAENVMIVDLLRNDLGRIAEVGSVTVPRLFGLQALPSVWQMTSDVQARLPRGTGLQTIFQALFPCGSITGAPKRSSMAAIAALEPAPRGWYCGALGVVRSDGAGGVRATFNVPIRTLVVQGASQVRCGIGSGITADAHAAGEWREWAAKRAFFERVSQPFDILETLALADGTLRHGAWHLERMARAAQHFAYPWDADAARAAVQTLACQHPQGLWRVRLLLHADGRFTAQAFACPSSPDQVLLHWAVAPLAQTHSEFVRFKTTRRGHYDALAPTAGSGAFDSLLFNAAGEITECTRGNIAALLDDGRWVTPPLACGLLPGIGRAVALQAGRVEEGVLRLEDVPRVRAWAFMNSLRGWIPAQVAGLPPVL
ncbi:chorismate-binding protein [Comamonas nitrativorans]|uniref:Chorismate-binding protein n=1 Tax=Comamonas nitrativorans TaxID=108437 RepID=A0ABV9GVP9_9BURK